MAGTVAPFFRQMFLDNNGEPAAGYQLFAYQAGTTTKQDTYSDAALTIPNTNPVILDSAGCCTLFLAATTYDFVLATPSDTDPPTSPLGTYEDIAAIPTSASSPDVPGTAGEDLTGLDAVYLADGTGGTTAGRWYKTSASNTYSSTLPNALGIVLADTASGAIGTIRQIGQVTGMSSLAAGTVYYLDTTGGALTSSPPANARAIGIADSTTTIILSQWVTVPAASSTVPGIVTTGTQTLGGTKTFTGAVLSSSATGGLGYATGAGGTVSQSTNKSTGVTLDKITGTITMHNAALNAGVTVSFTLTNSNIAATDLVVVNIKSGATADSYVAGVQSVGTGSCSIFLRNTTAATNLSEAVVLSFAVIKAVAA